MRLALAISASRSRSRDARAGAARDLAAFGRFEQAVGKIGRRRVV
jgi:hypothetical protein